MRLTTLRMRIVLAGSIVALSAAVTSAQSPQQGNQQRPRIVRKSSSALQASAITRVEPDYPPQALASQISGRVFVEVTVDENGAVTSARALSGHALLRSAAVDAARGWTFTPTLLQGKPVKVLGSLTFTFTLPQNIQRGRVIERIKAQVEKNPENAKLRYRLGTAYDENEQFEEAIKEYEQAVALNPEFGDAWYSLGKVNMKLNRYEEALRAYNRAVELNLASDNKAASYRAMATIYFRSDRFKEAVEPFKRAIALAPEGSMYFDLGVTYLKLGDKTSAMEQYRLLMERNSILAQQLLDQINNAK
jgi:TonB family protein